MEVAGALVALAVFLAGVWWIAFGSWDLLRARDDPGYAEAVFGPILPVAEVLESRRWHRRGAEPWDCTYAIVRLGTDAPAQPPASATGTAWWLAFGGDWKPTPEPELRSTIRDALEFCSRYWPALGTELQNLLSEPGHWVMRDRVGEDLHLYSAKARIAARIRYGD